MHSAAVTYLPSFSVSGDLAKNISSRHHALGQQITTLANN